MEKKWSQLKYRIVSTLLSQLGKWQSRRGYSRSIVLLSLMEMPPSWASYRQANPSDRAYPFIITCVADCNWHSSGLSSWERIPKGSQEVEGIQTLKYISHRCLALYQLWMDTVWEEIRKNMSHLMWFFNNQNGSKISLFTVSNVISLHEGNLSIWQEALKSVNVWMSR